MSDDLIKTLNAAHGALAEYGIDHALIGSLALGVHGVHRATVAANPVMDWNRVMDFERYLQFLAQYWSLFDWPEAVRRRRRPGSFHDIRL